MKVLSWDLWKSRRLSTHNRLLKSSQPRAPAVLLIVPWILFSTPVLNLLIVLSTTSDRRAFVDMHHHYSPVLNSASLQFYENRSASKIRYRLLSHYWCLRYPSLASFCYLLLAGKQHLSRRFIADRNATISNKDQRSCPRYLSNLNMVRSYITINDRTCVTGKIDWLCLTMELHSVWTSNVRVMQDWAHPTNIYGGW